MADVSKYQQSGAQKFEKNVDWLTRDLDLPVFRKKLNDLQRAKLYAQLSKLLSAGVDLKSAIEVLISQQGKKFTKDQLERSLENIVNGESLFESLNSEIGLSEYEYYSIKIGEETGKLSIILKELGGFFKQKVSQQRKFINAFSYPFVVIVTAIVVVIFMIRFLVPMFEGVYHQFGGEMPFLTQQLIFISNFLGHYGWLILLASFGLGIGYYLIRRRPRIRSIRSKILYATPILSELFKNYYLGRFSRYMYLLTSSKVGIISALQLTRKVISCYPLEIGLEVVEDEVMKGSSLSAAMESNPFFDEKTVALIKVGEEVNQLEEMFLELSDEYYEDFEQQTEVLNKFLEPALILFLGVVVGAILVALYLPMFKLSSSFNY